MSWLVALCECTGYADCPSGGKLLRPGDALVLKAVLQDEELQFACGTYEYLRVALAQSRALKSMSPFRVMAADLGGPAASGSYDDVEALLEESEGVEHR